MEQLTVKALFNLEETIAKDIFENVTYPWEVLPKIGSYIVELGSSLSEEEYDKVAENVWIAKTAKVARYAHMASWNLPGLLSAASRPTYMGVEQN